jgi:hypothetical protein
MMRPTRDVQAQMHRARSMQIACRRLIRHYQGGIHKVLLKVLTSQDGTAIPCWLHGPQAGGALCTKPRAARALKGAGTVLMHGRL